MQKKIFGLFAVLILITLALCACQAVKPSESDSANHKSEDLTDWKSVYKDYIEARETAYGKESDYGFDYRYALVYIDNDDIPELYASGAFEADGDLICSFRNGRVIEQYLRRNGGGKYVERSGIVLNENGNMGHYYTNVYKQDENGFSEILNVSYTVRYISSEIPGDDTHETVTEYFIDDKAVSEEAYHTAISQAVDLTKAVKLNENAVPYDAIIAQITE